jgi:hypothetical protein
VEQNCEQKTVKRRRGGKSGYQLLLADGFSAEGKSRRFSDPENA